jgi:predicted restriction endonuclease
MSPRAWASRPAEQGAGRSAAAHIRWHLAHGPDVECNWLALCVLHHKLFDLGAFTLSQDGMLVVSELANGSWCGATGSW